MRRERRLRGERGWMDRGGQKHNGLYVPYKKKVVKHFFDFAELILWAVWPMWSGPKAPEKVVNKRTFRQDNQRGRCELWGCRQGDRLCRHGHHFHACAEAWPLISSIPSYGPAAPVLSLRPPSGVWMYHPKTSNISSGSLLAFNITFHH